MPLAVEVALGSGCIIYDALFIALAEAEDAVVVTVDEQLLRSLEGTPFAERGKHLRDVSDLLPER